MPTNPKGWNQWSGMETQAASAWVAKPPYAYKDLYDRVDRILMRLLDSPRWPQYDEVASALWNLLGPELSHRGMQEQEIFGMAARAKVRMEPWREDQREKLRNWIENQLGKDPSLSEDALVHQIWDMRVMGTSAYGIRKLVRVERDKAHTQPYQRGSEIEELEAMLDRGERVEIRDNPWLLRELLKQWLVHHDEADRESLQIQTTVAIRWADPVTGTVRAAWPAWLKRLVAQVRLIKDPLADD